MRAPRRTRTADLFITNEMLYQLSYWGHARRRLNARGAARKAKAQHTRASAVGKVAEATSWISLNNCLLTRVCYCEANHLSGRHGLMQNRKSDRETALLNMGFEMQSVATGGVTILDVVKGDTSLAFSGYGEFTPITVRSDTVLDANLERNQR